MLSAADVIEECQVHIGTAVFIHEDGIHTPDLSTADDSSAIIVNIAIDKSYVCSMSLQDTIRSETPWSLTIYVITYH